jgi:hypothetical protein
MDIWRMPEMMIFLKIGEQRLIIRKEALVELKESIEYFLKEMEGEGVYK